MAVSPLAPPTAYSSEEEDQQQSSQQPQDTDSGSQTESSSDATPPKAKPIASKLGSKRAADNNTQNAKKRAKKESCISEDAKNGSYPLKKFQRRWSEEEELTLLNGVIDFTSKTGQDPVKFYNADKFHSFIRKSLDVEISKKQLMDKLRRMKRKLENGEGASVLKKKVFELLKKAWGSDQATGVVEKPKSNLIVPKRKENGRHNVGLILREFYRSKEAIGLDGDEVKRGLGLIRESVRAELKAKWTALRNAEMELQARRLELATEITELVVETLLSPHN